MIKYSIITQKCGSHLLMNALLKSIEKHLTPDEIIIEDNKFIEYSKSERHGLTMNKQILKARNDYVLMLDQDIMIFDNSLIEQMFQEVLKPNVYACGTYDYLYEGTLLLTPSCVMLNKKMHLENKEEFNGSGNPCWAAFGNAYVKSQKLIKIDGGKRIFHLGSGIRRPYSQLIVNNHWRSEFENWKKDNNSNVNFDDYVVDDGMDIDDLHQLNNIVLDQLDYKIKCREPFSMMRLGDLTLRLLWDYFYDPKDFSHIARNHAELAMPNEEICRKLTEEHIEGMKITDWLDHPYTYKGIMGNLFGWRQPLNRCSEIYEKCGINVKEKNFCSSLQSYLSLFKEFDRTLYDILKGRSIIYVAPYDTLGELNQRKNLEIAKYKYYQMPMESNRMLQHNAMENFFIDFKSDDWDLVVTSAGMYGRILLGCVRKLGGRAFDLGQAAGFCPNNIFDKVVIPIEDKTFYKLNEETCRG